MITLNVMIEFALDEARGLYVATSSFDEPGFGPKEIATFSESLLDDQTRAAFVELVKSAVFRTAQRCGGEVGDIQEITDIGPRESHN